MPLIALRTRLAEAGPLGLADQELLGLLLAPGLRAPTADTLAQRLLERFGGLAPVLGASLSRLSSVPGLGPARGCALQTVLEIGRRCTREELRHRDALDSPETVGRYLSLGLRHRPYEVFSALFLDSRNRLLACEELFRGTLTQTAVYPREVARRALEHNAAAVILAHNHPSGVAEPSQADRHLTAALRNALGHLDIPVLDHLIVAGPHTYSFAQHGLL